MARSTPRPDPRILRAQLDGHARFLLRERASRNDAIAELREITTDPRLLGEAAGVALAAWRFSEVTGWQGDEVADLLLGAGGDAAVMEEEAEVVAGRLAERTMSGIGNPTLSPPPAGNA